MPSRSAETLEFALSGLMCFRITQDNSGDKLEQIARTGLVFKDSAVEARAGTRGGLSQALVELKDSK